MTPEELKALIESDEQALALAKAGSADMCAARCREIAPKLPTKTVLTELSILALYDDPAVGEAVLQQIEAVAAGNPVVARVAKWMLPGTPGVDFGDARIRTLLTAPINAGGLGLSNEQAAPILSSAEVAQSISGADVSTAYPFTGGN